MSALRVALAQVNPTVGDLEANAALVQRKTQEAADDGAHLVAFGEMVLAGYPIEDLAVRASFRRAVTQRTDRLAADLAEAGLGHVVVVAGSLGTAADGRPTNTAVVLHGGQVQQVYTKHHLPNYGVFDEFRIFAPGDDPVLIQVQGRQVGLAICEDIWADGGTVGDLVDDDLDLLLVLNGSPYERGKSHLRTRLARQRANELGSALAYVNLFGGQDDLVFDGGSFVLDADGELIDSAPTFREHTLTVDLGSPGQAWTDRTTLAPAEDDVTQMYDAVVLGLRDYARKNGFTSVVLGLSGGIDSALVAAIAADALGPENVVGISMPSKYSSQHSRNDAADLAKRIGMRPENYRVQPIEAMFDAFQAELGGLDGLALENLQARIRGMLLMAFSNSEGHLVLATGNKSELAVGYSTIYGDAVGGFAPLKDVSKTRVWELSWHRNARARDAGQVEPIPENSITKPPSAELRPDQRDDQSLPDYDTLDPVLDAYVEYALGRTELLEAGFDAEVVDLVLRLVDRSEWKRRQYPLGPKVTSLAFGRDRRLPVTSAFREHRPTTGEG